MRQTTNSATSGAGLARSPWLQRFHPEPDAPVRLVCLPHAGGSASYYHPLSAALRDTFDVLVVQYPGRQNRYTEPPLTSVAALADGVVEALTPWLDRPLVIFGHSMGSLIGFEAARRLTAAGSPPRALVASGRRAPDRHRDGDIHRRDDAGVLAEMRRLGGTGTGLLEDPEIRALVLPAIRGDFQATETYRFTPGPPLPCPLLALVGDADPVAELAEVRDWARHTSADFRLRTFPGDHFYLADQFPAVADTVRQHLTALAG
ncbi:alpha/beta fold hydrolase [Streptomyces sp. DSM 44915]|uniref:Alpha/beta fold hydrolase n=1 Tax=Streptomyces chisholmiae TaxID=3075540 RepID=A0ABU2JM43_9ACTN|nr:alpha/beta fold hydrolase [Streptomyces sp. DSM 44915]MDT0265987.1 alpha/beta fold hydrolase [Streptomyces sp. DSM 44915]